MPKIVFVCTGNTCRSPMAELLFEKMLEEQNLKGWEVLSAGVSAFPGQPISRESAEVLQEEGIKSDKHVSKQLSEEMLAEAILVLTMTGRHKQLILDKFPAYADIVYTIKEYALSDSSDTIDNDIIDPFGQSPDIYRKTKIEIKQLLKSILVKLSQSKNDAGNCE